MGAMQPAEFDLEALRTDLVASADPEKVEGMTWYMKGKFTFLGVQTKARRAASKPLLAAAKHADPDDLIALAVALWEQPEREFHYVGMDALRAGADRLRASDLDTVRSLIVATPWWDTVDSLAAWTVGPMVAAHPELVAEMDRWIELDDIWLARTAILHQLGYKERTDEDRLFRYALRRAGDTDFFIRKGIGWALRQYARVAPDAVRSFVRENEDRFSGLTRREAMKHLG